MKRLLGHFKIATKMMLPPLVVFICLVTVVMAALSMISIVNRSMDDLYTKRFKGYKDSSKILIESSAMQRDLYKSLNLIEAGYDTKKIDDLLKQQVIKAKETVEFLKAILGSEDLSDAEKGHYKAALEPLLILQRKADFFLETATLNPPLAVMAMLEGEEALQGMNKTLNDLHALEDTLSKESYEESIKGYKNTFRIFLVLVLISVILSFVATVGVARMVLRPIRAAITVLCKVAEGDLTQKITAESRDEIGDLVQSVDQMRTKMGGAVGKAMIISEGLREAASEEAASIEETSASLNEIASMTQRTAENTIAANELMTSAREAIKKANESMAGLTRSMKEITGASEQTQKIVKSIDAIAFQTNLLALNAAVEAARAGESGAGFAVVADEVRNLAMRAAESAKNSSDMIADTVLKVREGEKLVSMTDGAFSEVTVSSEKVVSFMEEISAASKEQAEGITQVNKAIAEMSITTQRTAGNAEDLTSAMLVFKTEGHEK